MTYRPSIDPILYEATIDIVMALHIDDDWHMIMIKHLNAGLFMLTMP